MRLLPGTEPSPLQRQIYQAEPWTHSGIKQEPFIRGAQSSQAFHRGSSWVSHGHGPCFPSSSASSCFLPAPSARSSETPSSEAPFLPEFIGRCQDSLSRFKLDEIEGLQHCHSFSPLCADGEVGVSEIKTAVNTVPPAMTPLSLTVDTRVKCLGRRITSCGISKGKGRMRKELALASEFLHYLFFCFCP